MARGYAERTIPLLVNGAIDTKTNPKLLQPPALIELENVYQLRTGELTPRTGCAVQVVTRTITNGQNLFVTANGGLGTLSGGWLGTFPHVQPLRYGTGGSTVGWETNTSPGSPSAGVEHQPPMVTALITGVPLPPMSTTTTQPDTVDPDACLSGGLTLTVWADTIGGTIWTDFRDTVSGKTSGSIQVPSLAVGRYPKVGSTGGGRAAIFGTTGSTLAAVPFLNGVTGSPFTIAVNLDAANPWFDIKAIPGGSNFAVAYKVTGGGGVTCGIYNPAAGTFTSTVTTAAADASFTMGWLDDSFTTGVMYLATAGSTAGVIVREMSATTMVVSATRTIDATATSGIRNITGHLTSATPNYTVLWDVSGSSTIFDKVMRGRWTGAATVTERSPNHSLYSRSAKFSDGNYYALGCFNSSVQPTYALLTIEPNGSGIAPPQCHIFGGEAGPRRQQNSLATASLTTDSTILIPAVRARKIATPDGAAASQTKSLAILTCTVMGKVTHAREIGGTVFYPGGIVQQDDGAVMGAATFPLYPEVPTAVTAGGGSMTGGGAYLYRTVFRTIDAKGRVIRSAGSIPQAVTLGATDGTANLSLFNLRFARSTFLTSNNNIWQEVYRRGPSASGATLYNKVGEVRMDWTGANTVAFSDTMSDANAALGEIAYFNGNVLENFNPPATSLLEVNGNRVGIVNAEDPTEFWFSKEYKAGGGIGFNPLLKVQISGDGAGGMTALASMDGRWILFKRSAIYVLSGDGPNDLGQGSFNAPQAVSRVLGTTNPSSVIETPDGVMFQSTAGGIWTLGRDLGLTYIGAPVESYCLAGTVVGCSLSGVGMTTVRFALRGGGRVLEWDYHHKRWYTHVVYTNGDNIVDCVYAPIFGWCYLMQGGVLLKEVQASTTDFDGGNFAIIPRISFPQIQLAGLAGYQRLHAIDITLEATGSFTLSVDAEYNFSGSVTGTPKTIAVVAGTVQDQYTPPEGKSKCTAIRPVITVTGNPTNTFKLTGATARVSVKRGSDISAGSRLT